ncbi:hypothetical protein ASE74_12350 [Pedobacter sp. Leaf216]|uniref:glycosyltransferase n=1 Tax=Pedobacter sp. Leaf216 TaxID=1735684 RepID=UPI000701E034|nr:glycosyltransferase [Pedobacter sp. Leaf216]KQM63951.1 hypothetical protein ASE74_12350 [Pedobacter sp. Leaf216]
MINNIKNSLAYRIPIIYQFLLKFRPYKTRYSEPSENVIVMMTGKAHINMVCICLLTISKKWSRLPALIIISDGTISEDKIAKRLKFWKGKISIDNWEKSCNYHLERGREAIGQYAKLNAFGKKLAIILHHAESKPVVWIDSDILFFNDFLPFWPKDIEETSCGGSADWKAAYDERLLSFFGSNLVKYGSFNAGMVYAHGLNLYEKYNIEFALNAIHPNYDFLSEQTIFAEMASNSLGILWDQNIIGNFHEDNQSLTPTKKKLIGRHYTSNVRHLFWRDAFFLT